MTIEIPTTAPSLVRGAFAVGGQMGETIRSIDWSATPLGPIESWPAGLRTTVSLALGSTFPISIIWGPGHVQIYNDGYWPICGAKHPTSMGQDFRQCWASAFPIIGAAYERAWSGEADFLENQRMFLDRNGFLEETFFTFSFSPIRDETGQVAGLFHPVTETTLQMLSERRTRCLRDLAAQSGNAADVGEACELAAKTFGEYELDLPFARLYRLSVDGRSLHLEACSGHRPGEPSLAVSEDITADGHGWPFADALDSERGIEVEDLEQRIGALTCGPYPESPRTALMIPIRIAGVERPYGILVAGVSARLSLDAAYRDFFVLLGNAVAVLIGNARAYDDERRRAEALAELDRAKTTFFSNISHEFRTPLTLLLGPLQNALDLAEPDLRGADLETAHRNAQRLLKLVNQLLDYSRVEAGRAEPGCRPTDLAALTADLASAFRSAVEHGGLALNVDCPPLARPIDVDPDMWEKVVLNLVSNAFKFTFDGSIDVATVEHEENVVLTVRDTGVGIAAQQLPRVFERFHRIEGVRARTHEGTGIGLALVRDLVMLHGGDIGVTSEVGHGTTFTVTIPRLQRETTRTPVVSATAQKDAFVAEAMRWLPAPESAEPSPARALSPLARILLADDNADMRDYLRRLLAERWSVEAVADGEQALAVARAGAFDLVVADVMMPRLDGFGLVAALRADERTASLPILLLSARAGEEAIAEGLRAGADEYVVKPFTASSLLARIETLLAANRARQLTKELAAAARQRLYSLLMNAPAAMCSLRGPEMLVELANTKILELWGKDATVIGKHLLDVLPEIADQPFPELLREVMRTGVPFVANESLARLDTERDGVLRDTFLDLIYAPTREDDGTVGVLVFAVDVTQKVAIRRALEAALGDARNANSAKDDFLALLGHELRNPLAPITTALEMTELRGFTGVEKEAAVIGRQTTHLSHLVDDLLDVSRITSGKVELDRRAIELGGIVTMSVELASPLFEQKQHHLAVDVSAGLVVDVDPNRMAQVLSNLLTNAAKYTNGGGSISIAAKADGEHAVITVRDNGVGISADMLPNVFDMFMQERRSVEQSRGGLGLGLTIVKSLVTQHGGSVSAHSEGRGQGSEFEVRLPLTRERGVASERPTTLHQWIGKTPHRVLIVDDNVDAARTLADAISALGHETRIAYDGPAALKIVEGFTPELALLDLGLPAMDGYELGRRLRSTKPLAALRLVAVTGYGQPSDRERTHASGFDAHLVKPVDVRGLASLIDQLLQPA